ncbi:hypothetical protein A9239_08960 [Methanosarcina sp. A14]|nr:hypothetical protein A9239_08960 [Methanosarcina sp. A14]
MFTALALIRVEYVPEWKIDAEKSHMNDVQKDMIELKSTADILSLLMASDSNFSASGLPITIPFIMGGGEIPILEPSKSSGMLSVSMERCKMTIIPKRLLVSDSLQVEEDAKKIECGGITYRSNNREYLDQVLRYENGALILAQGEKSVMKEFPSFNIEKTSEKNYTVSIQAIKIRGEPDAVSSNADVSLRLTGISNNVTYNSNDTGDIASFYGTVITEYPDAWISYLNETAKNAGLEYGTDYDLDKPSSNFVYFNFTSTNNKTLQSLSISESVIQADLGTGLSSSSEDVNWSESGEDENTEHEDKSIMELGEWYYFDMFSGTYEETLMSVSSIDPNMLTDRDEDYSLPVGSFKNYELSPYSEVNDFNYSMNNNGKTLNLNFGYNNFSSFNSTSIPTKATICMIYSFSGSKEPNIVMTLTGTERGTFKPNSGWCLYNQTFSISSKDPEEITLNLKVITDSGSNAAGTFRIDYLAVYLS